jgi:DNA-binding NarL/FixJ family response regulator
MLQREQGDLASARECLRRALDCASAAGAPALARGIREELVAAGAKPRRTSSESAATLTPSERRVAELAAQGLTNRQIAQALFVTVKTVEWHLRNAFVKLRITSRRELQPVLREAA